MKNVILALLCLISVLIIDQVSKRLGVDPQMIHWNHGIVFGLYSKVSPTLRIITLCSFGGFLLAIYFFLLFFIPKTILSLKIGLSFLIGGVLGNVIDRMVDGRTIDFIPMPGLEVVFNFADVFQWIGAGLILWNIWQRGGEIWRPDNQRGNYLILPREQLQFCLKLLAITFATSSIVGIFSFAYLRVILIESRLANSEAILTNFALAYFFIVLVFCVIVFVFGLYVSHRSAGPIHAFSLFVEDLTQGKIRDFQLRDRDHFKQLEKIALRLQDHFKK
ncbi:MAG: hypothetical protein CME71_07115 [Halobacteriovorax sp.]|nr:hypothetical protein [Halobacteriovorax sp.]